MTTIDQIIAEKIGSWYVGEWPIGNFFLCLIAMVLSVILCGAIGIERERRGRSAGLRTHLLVGMGSCLIMIISIYGFPQAFQERRDVARLAAGIITGVGFLGAGTIIYRNSGAKGLTTAATIWITMAIGLACGSMNFILATGGTILMLLVLVLFRRIEARLNKKSPLVIIQSKDNYPVVASLIMIAEEMDCSVNELQVGHLESGALEITFYAISHSKDFDVTELIKRLQAVDGVIYVSLLNSHKA